MLRQRILTAVALGGGLLVVLLLLPQSVALGVFALIVLVGAWEWSSFPRFPAQLARFVYVLAIAVAMALAYQATRDAARLNALLYFALAWWAVAFLWVTLAPAAHNRATVALAGLIVLVPAWVALANLYQSSDEGAVRVLFLLVLVWAADIGAFFAGRAYGRLKLAPRVSPSKTWEGVLGGLALSALIAAVSAGWFQLPRLAFLSLCLAVVLLSIVGDLTESMFKRYAGLKDSGSIFPGHGGMLDRIDSVTAAAPAFLLGLRWLEGAP
jgi:phosphatidate cytidylyltransferase